MARQVRPSRPASVYSFSTLRLDLVLFLPPFSATKASIHSVNRRRPVPEFYQVTHLRTDGVPCRESADIEPVALKVVPLTGAMLPFFQVSPHGPTFFMPPAVFL